ncbi:MAG: hypothetical protein WA840_11325 [Caulobacteraceae bacterium]
MAAVVFVSKRLAPMAAALLCLMAGRLVASVTATASAASPTEVRVAITR